MKLKLIKEREFEFYYSLLEKDFCFEERREKVDELKMLKNKHFKPCYIFDNNMLIGYFCYWDLGEFLFGEHFAILENLRDQGWGTKFLTYFLQNLKKPFVFEMEKPLDTQSKKRKKFYEKFAFVFNDFDYHQPSYHGDDKEIPMIFVSYPEKLTSERYNKMVKKIRKEVYKN